MLHFPVPALRCGALLSIHDVTPSAIPRVEDLLRDIRRTGHGPISLLVIPGSGWTTASIRRLRVWQREGHVLVAHGYFHKAPEPRRVSHWLHRALFSRGVAEHLGQTRRQLLGVVRQSARWFEDAGLGIPEMYVPPAWALGPLELEDFRRTPFRRVETLCGLYDVAAGQFQRLPLVGFEADTRWRASALRMWNRINSRWATVGGLALRVAIHPNDAHLLMAADLRLLLELQLGAPAHSRAATR